MLWKPGPKRPTLLNCTASAHVPSEPVAPLDLIVPLVAKLNLPKKFQLPPSIRWSILETYVLPLCIIGM